MMVTTAKVILLWPQRAPRIGWSASLLYETVDGTLTELFSITRANREELVKSLADVCPGVRIVSLENMSSRQ